MMTMSSFRANPREGHLKRVKRIVAIEAGQERRRQTLLMQQQQRRQSQQGAEASTKPNAAKTDEAALVTSSTGKYDGGPKTSQDAAASSTTMTSPTPTKLVSQQQHALSLVPKIVSIHAAGSYSAALSSSGHIYTWGCNDVGNLGLPVVRPSLMENGSDIPHEQDMHTTAAKVPLPLLEPGEPISATAAEELRWTPVRL